MKPGSRRLDRGRPASYLAPALDGQAKRLDQRRPLWSLELVHRALTWKPVRAPTLEASAVTESVTRQLVVTDLDHEHGPDATKDRSFSPVNG